MTATAKAFVWKRRQGKNRLEDGRKSGTIDCKRNFRMPATANQIVVYQPIYNLDMIIAVGYRVNSLDAGSGEREAA